MEPKQMVHCALQIEKLSNDGSFGSVTTLLCDLEKCRVTSEALEITDAVKVLYRVMKTCSDESAKKKIKTLLSRWKKQHGEERAKHFRSEPAQSGDGQGCSEGKCTPEKPAPPEEGPSASVRAKCAQLLLAALGGEGSDGDQATLLSGSIEQHLHELHGANQLKYKSQVRSKVANLRNPKNGHLRRGLLGGSLTPGAFARMSPEEMACAELRQLRGEYSARGVSERQLPQGVGGTPTRKLRCQRCGGRDCRVTQLASGALFLPAWVRRSGPDHDAMTFVTCGVCGQQWYHSAWACL